MEVKLMILLLVVLTLVGNNHVVADFFFNHPLPKLDSIQHSHRYNCVPGRTIIKVTEKTIAVLNGPETDSDEYKLRMGPSRKMHMTVPSQDESCRMCVCSVNGRDEYCSNRPASNVNECLVMKDIVDKFQSGMPFNHLNDLSYRIRRDYIWHNDEIPYESRAKCFRGHSYYSNSVTANDTDIDVATEIESLLDYDNELTCYFCVCSVDGAAAGCIHRDVSFCNFFRVIRNDKHIRDRYTSLLQQDRPSYFRQLSFRMRRTMDKGIFDLIDTVGTNNGPGDSKKCVPFVSQYTDCNDDNLCSGCSRCTCTADEEWSCEEVSECDSNDGVYDKMEDEDEIFDNALNMLEYKMDTRTFQDMKKSKNPYVPSPQVSKSLDQNTLLDSVKMYRMDELVSGLLRSRRAAVAKTSKHKKRSVDKTSHKHGKTANSGNNSIRFYDTVDELNEDTLKTSNITGTLTAKKVDMAPKVVNSRRSNDVDNSSKAFQIDFNQPKIFHQITDNKIEATESENKFGHSHENFKSVLGNYTQNVKDKDLSKIVVNELKSGKEVIGDASAPVTSNITFTPENDTLNAMAFIAGNLLNKLWNMEKDASGSSVETDAIKHEKIADLLDLFKEPLNLRQEIFLKNALEHLSLALDKHKDVKNISLCADIENSKKVLYDTNSTSQEEINSNKTKIEVKTSYKKDNSNSDVDKQKMATIKAISKINNVLELIKKFENIQGSLSDLKHGPKLDINLNNTTVRKGQDEPDTNLTNDEKNSLNMFGNLLDKITKLIMPKRNNKKIANRIKSQNMLANNDILKKKFKKMYNIDLTNMTMTAKDKLILDYLTHVERNPDCLFNNNNNQKIPNESSSSIEGNILLNLSEFFKLKSFSDLINLLEPEKRSSLRTATKTTNQVETTTFSKEKQASMSVKDELTKFNSTKEKLKAHLKTILEDLLELQIAKGGNRKSNIKIADALPCIYNVLKASQEEITTKKDEKNEPKKIADIFNDMKKALKTAQLRRSYGDIMTVRPKSAVVWERLVKTLNDQSNLKSRRFLQNKTPKTYEQIKVKMDRIENGSSSYKHYALLVPLPPTGRLMLLRSLEQDTLSTIDVIQDIQQSLETLSKLPADKFAEIQEFVDNLATRLNLSVKVDEKIKPELRKYFVNNINSGYKATRNKLIKKKPNLRLTETRSVETEEMKVTRNQIVNQLIRNRMQLFIKMKEDSEFDVNHDVNYKIAQRVLHYLDTGNYDLAKELFRVFVTQKQIKLGIFSNTASTSDTFLVTSPPKQDENPMRRMASPQKKSLVEFEDQSRVNEKHINWVNQDHLVKQLLNIKNMGM